MALASKSPKIGGGMESMAMATILLLFKYSKQVPSRVYRRKVPLGHGKPEQWWSAEGDFEASSEKGATSPSKSAGLQNECYPLSSTCPDPNRHARSARAVEVEIVEEP